MTKVNISNSLDESVGNLGAYVSKFWPNIKIAHVHLPAEDGTTLCMSGDRGIEAHLEVNIGSHDLTVHTPEENAIHLAVLITNMLNEAVTFGKTGQMPRRFFFFGSQTRWSKEVRLDTFILNMYTRKEEYSMHGNFVKVTFKEKITGNEVYTYIDGDTNDLATERDYVYHNTHHTEIHVVEHTDSNVFLSSQHPTLLIPEMNSQGVYQEPGEITRVEILEKTPSLVRVKYHYCKVLETAQYASLVYIAKMTNTGEIVLDCEEIPHEDWMYQIETLHDLEKNPSNTKVHPFLSDHPHYESDKVFVSSQQIVYVNTEYGWVSAGLLDGLVYRKKTHPELRKICERVSLSIQLMD